MTLPALADGQAVASAHTEALKGRKWDVCIDNPTSVPHWIRDAAAVLKGNINHFVFISTLSVYADDTALCGHDHRDPPGPFNAPGPAQELRMGRMLDEIRKGIGSRAEQVEASAAFLRENRVSAWADLPVWVPGQGETAGFHRRSNAQEEKRKVLRAGLKPEREAELLAKLKG